MKTNRSFTQYFAYSVTRQGRAVVFESKNRDCILRKIYQYACGFAGCGCIVRSLRAAAGGFVAVIKLVPSWDARRLTVAAWNNL